MDKENEAVVEYMPTNGTTAWLIVTHSRLFNSVSYLVLLINVVGLHNDSFLNQQSINMICNSLS